MESTLISHELDEMRSQLGILKDKLEKQTIINEKHIRNSIKSKASDMNKIIGGTIFGGVFAVIFCPLWCILSDLSLAFTIVTTVMVVVSLAATIYQKVILGRVDFSQGNMVEIATELGRVRKHYIEWSRIVAPLIVIPWLAWTMYELTKVEDAPDVLILCVSVGVGGLIGALIGLSINRKVVRKVDEILNQVKELQNEN